MSTILTQYVDTLADHEKMAIIRSYEQFEKDGFIGDEPVRQHALRLIKEYGLSNDHITMWMREVAVECFRFYAKKYIEAYTA